jgi:hypothetical protein
MDEEPKPSPDYVRERKAQLIANSRLSLPTSVRITLATASSFVLGLGLGVSHGSQTAGLRFRAENAHRLPKTPTGWYFYHKSKNYQMAYAGVKEGLKMGFKISAWVAAFFYIEDRWDEFRGQKDFVNTVVASLTVTGGFSLWSKLLSGTVYRTTADEVIDRFPIVAAARTAKTSLAIGLAFGLAQDAVGAMRGRRPAYVDFILRGRGKLDKQRFNAT